MNYGALMQLAIQMYGEQAASKMTAEQLRLLEQQVSNVQGVKLPDLPQVQPEQLGDSAVAGMTTDPEMRNKQLAALAQIQNLIDSNGMDLQSKAALEDALNQTNKQQTRARAGVAADAAARGQLNSGARLLMDMNGAQSGANSARAAGTQAAADAAQRRIQAIRDASSMEGNLREMDWREKESSARAKDLRDELNRGAREKASLYNAGLPQQNFQNAMQKATGTGGPTNNLAAAYAGQAQDTRNAAAGYGQAAYEGFNGKNAGGAEPPATTYTYNPDETGDRGGYTDLSKDDPEK